MRKLRVLVLMERGNVPPESVEGLSDEQTSPFRAELQVCSTLKKLKHEIRQVELYDDLTPAREAITDFKPHVAFNLMDGFRDIHIYDQHVVSYLELIQLPYTGCNPRGLTLARDKALTKKIMAYHRIRTPAFAVFPRGRAIKRPEKLRFPLMVKSLSVEGSIGISQASVVHDDEKLAERVKFIHDSLETYAIAEEYVEGRELYVGVMGNGRIKVFPPRELDLSKLPEGAPRIATRRIKFDLRYQKRWGVTSRDADDLDPVVRTQLLHLCKRIYRVLCLSGYARMDFRMTPTGSLYFLEANPNPHIGEEEDFAESAKTAGIPYGKLIQKILNLALVYHPESLT
jgi:D-alanine-D-alanine ligase